MHLRRLALYALLCLISWGLAHSAFVVVDGLTGSRESADAAVVLGNTVNRDGTLSERLRQRVACGLRLYQAGRVKTLIVSGGLGREGFYEGSKMRDYLRQQGVPDSAIVVDNYGDDTRQTVVNTLPILDSLHARRLLVVSQYYHLTRTKMLFRRAGWPPVGSVSPVYFELRDLYSLAREFPAYYQQLLAE
ncbi:YdcF family protein [Hymenobacter persicinus]|uniref:YdcF family protein n=1 Tax=Hymenobacter persicinus TaxID=2025506 RepID=A0A4Q5L885_9BACT|nr:YdcF family protein [Hymenobacter persicinus]RYU75618.1 YdcF family protein [Hymenobacter persicinus]